MQIRDAFISEISSNYICQRLLENPVLELQTAFDKACALDIAQKNSEEYNPTNSQLPSNVVALADTEEINPDNETTAAAVSSYMHKKCQFCGNSAHNQKNCPARNVTCHNCGKNGHFSKVCRFKGRPSQDVTAALFQPSLCALPEGCPKNLSQAAVTLKIGNKHLTGLMDSCSSDNFISQAVINDLKLKCNPCDKTVSMALENVKAKYIGICHAGIELSGRWYANVWIGVLENLCSDVILGFEFQRQHKNLIFEYGGGKHDLVVLPNDSTDTSCALLSARVNIPSLFSSIPGHIKPVATTSRRFNKADQSFINNEISWLLADGIIEPCFSPWRAQLVVAKDTENQHKKRLCVDYSQTVNLYTQLDAYPLPRIDDMVNNLAKYTVFSIFDLKSAYHQIPIIETDEKYTAFEANGRLYQFCRIPFGVTTGVAMFQRSMDKFVEDENLTDTSPYLDNITVGGYNQEHHDENCRKFHDAVKAWPHPE